VTVVRVLPDVPAVDREFDYLLPPGVTVEIGSMVRVPLHGRRVGGWVTAVDVEPPARVQLVEVAKVSGVGPTPGMLELCRWAAWRWAGHLATFLRMASPPTMVQRLPPNRRFAPAADVSAWSFEEPRAVLRLPPPEDALGLAAAATRLGPALIVCPSISQAKGLAAGLRAGGASVVTHPEGWAQARAGQVTVVGTRSAAFAPLEGLAAVVVIDEHDEALQQEGSPTWHAREVCLERARRARVPALLVSPCPSPEAVRRSPLRTVERNRERQGWPVVRVLDLREEDRARTGLFAAGLPAALPTEGRLLFVLNRTGRAGLLACRGCRNLVRCDRCDAAVRQRDDRMLWCARCGSERPPVCTHCGRTDLSAIRVGVTRAREELAALLREPVGIGAGAERVVLGTEAVLHGPPGDSVAVVFVEFDQELTAPRYRAAEEALGLLARAARRVGGRRGLLVIQTRIPDHEVVRAAVRADPSIVLDAEIARREALRFPPAVTMALVGGEAAPRFIERLGTPPGVEVDRRGDAWLLRSADRRVLLDALAAVPRPPGRLRLQVDPARLRQVPGRSP
jgi:primosomal protein N' (replication factor Y)